MPESAGRGSPRARVRVVVDSALHVLLGRVSAQRRGLLCTPARGHYRIYFLLDRRTRCRQRDRAGTLGRPRLLSRSDLISPLKFRARKSTSLITKETPKPRRQYNPAI